MPTTLSERGVDRPLLRGSSGLSSCVPGQLPEFLRTISEFRRLEGLLPEFLRLSGLLADLVLALGEGLSPSPSVVPLTQPSSGCPSFLRLPVCATLNEFRRLPPPAFEEALLARLVNLRAMMATLRALEAASASPLDPQRAAAARWISCCSSGKSSFTCATNKSHQRGAWHVANLHLPSSCGQRVGIVPRAWSNCARRRIDTSQ